jgi:hypothetical protein
MLLELPGNGILDHSRKQDEGEDRQAQPNLSFPVQKDGDDIEYQRIKYQEVDRAEQPVIQHEHIQADKYREIAIDRIQVKGDDIQEGEQVPKDQVDDQAQPFIPDTGVPNIPGSDHIYWVKFNSDKEGNFLKKSIPGAPNGPFEEYNGPNKVFWGTVFGNEFILVGQSLSEAGVLSCPAG